VKCLQLTATAWRCGGIENCQHVTDAKFINESSLFILLLGVIRRLELKPSSEQKLSIYSSPRHIAKPSVAVSAFVPSLYLVRLVWPNLFLVEQSLKNPNFFFVFISPSLCHGANLYLFFFVYLQIRMMLTAVN
jgi:hypothetical protein